MYNLGTGHGTSVLEMVAAFEKASGVVCVLLGQSILCEVGVSVVPACAH